jgi:hypothetical protein
MCIYSGNFACEHPECIQSTQEPDSISNSWEIIETMCRLLTIQNQSLQLVIKNTQSLEEKIEYLSEKTKIIKTKEDLYAIPPTVQIQNPILENEDFQYQIVLLKDLPAFIYKEKGFSITIGLTDSSSKRLYIPSNFNFIIELHTMETPSRVLSVNIHGKKIIRGTTSSFSLDNWKVEFLNIVVNEVSSHYPNGCLRIVVFYAGSGLISPLMINNLFVRARKNKSN